MLLDRTSNIYQGTTKEGDKDYIVRASLSPTIDLTHQEVSLKFVENM
jgi:hypothetical protein